MEHVRKWLGHLSMQQTERVYAFLEVDQLHKAVQGVGTKTGTGTEDSKTPHPETP